MKRWKQRLLLVALATAGVIGCKQQLFITEADLDHYRTKHLSLGAPENLENDPTAAITPTLKKLPPPPATVNDPDRPIRYMTLQEAIAIALEQGNIGQQSLQFAGQINENLQPNFTDSIRVFAMDPAVSGARIEAALSRFDVLYASSATWSKRDEANVNTFATNGDFFSGSTGLYKALPAGGVVGITASLDYQKFDLNTTNANFIRFNASYRPRLKFQFEQPLLQSYGVDINQVTPVHGGAAGLVSIREAAGLSGRVQTSGEGREGILVTRVRFDQSKAEFERNVNFMLLNVEQAYWNLYASYGALFARDRALIEAYELWKILDNRRELQQPQDEKRARAQLEQFRAQRIQALGDVLEKERQLRGLLGMHYDGTRLVPSDEPTTAPFGPDWHAGINDAIANRPELILARQELKLRQFDIMVNRNLLKPDLRFFASYDLNGIGERLDGSAFFTKADQFGIPQTVPHNALANIAFNKNNNWEMGLRFDVPLGFRNAHAATRIARLNLIRTYAALADTERKVTEQLRNQFFRLAEHQRLIQAQHAQFVAATQQYTILKNRRDLQDLPATLEQMLSAQRTIAESRAAEFRAIADYNNTLAGWHAAKGTLIAYDNVSINEGPLPEVAQVRAADHFRERTRALVLRERSTADALPTNASAIDQDPLTEVLPPPVESPQSVPMMMRGSPRPGVMPAGGVPGPATAVPAVPPAPWTMPAGPVYPNTR